VEGRMKEKRSKKGPAKKPTVPINQKLRREKVEKEANGIMLNLHSLFQQTI